ncbi:MAG TPA: alkane 1-monooxygenase [Caulobacteraceae bacterium]
MSEMAAPQGKPWVDAKRWLWLLGPVVPLLVVSSMWTFYSTGDTLALFRPWLFVYVIIPILDLVFGTDKSNPPESAVSNLEADNYYRALVAAFVPIQLFVTIWGAWIVGTQPLAWYEYVGMIFGVGLLNGVAIVVAHELGHKDVPWERWVAKITLGPVAYGHFYVEHNRGHHVRVATPEDPASSRLGESFWAFLPRTVIGSLTSAWELEAERLKRKGLPVWHWSNDNLQAWAMTVVLFGALTAWLGWIVLPFLVLQAAYGASLLEVVNYIEHYGLLRAKDPKTGRYVRCSPEHSWNSNHIVTNLFLYQLQRHSDHHANPMRRYQALRHFDESPQLPSGYASMLLLAYVPPLWRLVMDKRVVEHYGGDLSRANIQPSKRAKYLARYAAA